MFKSSVYRKNRSDRWNKGKAFTPEGVDQRVLLDGRLIQQGGQEGGVGGLAVNAAVVDRLSARLARGAAEERLGAGEGEALRAPGLWQPDGGRGNGVITNTSQAEVKLSLSDGALAWCCSSWLRPHGGSRCCGPDDCRQGGGCIWTWSSWRAANRSAAPCPLCRMMAANRWNWEKEEQAGISHGGETRTKLAANSITEQDLTAAAVKGSFGFIITHTAAWKERGGHRCFNYSFFVLQSDEDYISGPTAKFTIQHTIHQYWSICRLPIANTLPEDSQRVIWHRSANLTYIQARSL